MEERILAKSERQNIGRVLLAIFAGLLAIGVLLWYACFFHPEVVDAVENWGDKNGFPRAWTYSRVELLIIVGAVCFIGCIFLIINKWLCSCEMVVTDKRVYGKAAFGKRVDLPMDAVSAIGSAWPKGIAVATSSGKISFLMIQNSDEIHKSVSELLISRQGKQAETTVIKQEIPQSNADELKKFKELLDSGVITQEEFDAKKKQLLGL